jgi:hypothetical protein
MRVKNLVNQTPQLMKDVAADAALNDRRRPLTQRSKQARLLRTRLRHPAKSSPTWLSARNSGTVAAVRVRHLHR